MNSSSENGSLRESNEAETNADASEWKTVKTSKSVRPNRKPAKSKANQLEQLQKPYLVEDAGDCDAYTNELIDFIESNKKRVLIVMRGVPGSGKSYLAS
jgi:hypothetical protein